MKAVARIARLAYIDRVRSKPLVKLFGLVKYVTKMVTGCYKNDKSSYICNFCIIGLKVFFQLNMKIFTKNTISRFYCNIFFCLICRNRDHDQSNEAPIHEYKSGKKSKIIHKTVQCWIRDSQFNETDQFDLALKNVRHISLTLKM